MTKNVVQEIATRMNARHNCLERGNDEWFERHTAEVHRLTKQFMPSGSGIDNGTKLDIDGSHENKLVFTFGYHHMNDGGYYDGWTEHTAIVTPSLQNGFTVKITGRDRNEIKDHLWETFWHALSQQIEWDKETESFRAIHPEVSQVD